MNGEVASCATYDPIVKDEERVKCEVWDRVMGYHRPVTEWNKGKQQEHKDRVRFHELA